MALPPGPDLLSWDVSPNTGSSAIQRARDLLGSQQNHTLGQTILATAGLTGVAANLANMHPLGPSPLGGPLSSGQFDPAALLSLMRQHQEQSAQLGAGPTDGLRSQGPSAAGLATPSVVMGRGGVGGAGEGEVGGLRGLSPDLGQGQLNDETGGGLPNVSGSSGSQSQGSQWRQAYAGAVHNMSPTVAGTSPSQAFAPPTSNPQASQGGATTPATGATAVKSKTRARRGQATDPHSIAERLRRERIADRMKSLQELVPNATRVDKASMLDEIIEYVRFLQLQVKMLSMSRLDGPAAEAVMRLMDELEKENFQALGAPGMTDTEMKHTERQVALLLETDMAGAMQYLQSKGLCLMPLALSSPLPDNDTLLVPSEVKIEPEGDQDLGELRDEEGLDEGLDSAMEDISNAGEMEGRAS